MDGALIALITRTKQLPPPTIYRLVCYWAIMIQLDNHATAVQVESSMQTKWRRFFVVAAPIDLIDANINDDHYASSIRVFV